MKILILANNDVGLYQFRRKLIETMLQQGHQVLISLPDGIRIGKDAFFGCDQLTILCAEGSSGQEYAIAYGIPYVIR